MRVEREERLKKKFDVKKISEIGAQIEGILLKNESELTKKEINLLVYVKTYLLYREHSQENSYTEALEKARKIMAIDREELLALHFWVRGSRKNIKDSFNPHELNSLRERVDEKIEEIENLSSLCK